MNNNSNNVVGVRQIIKENSKYQSIVENLEI